MMRLLWATALLLGCAERYGGSPSGDLPPPTPISSLDGLPGATCGTPLMVWVTRQDGSQFCIDRFEASLNGGALGNTHQAGGDDTSSASDGSTQAAATVGLRAQPARNVSWYQARDACLNAGKRLCEVDEWERACRGPSALIYPYGDTIDDHACNGFFQPYKEKPAATGSFSACGSYFGAYDMSGNLEEWTNTPMEERPGSGTFDSRALRGGSYDANAKALACVGPEFYARPGAAAPDRGFRCCADGPL